jgi:lipopolysaccharide transport system ATP-binding protein
MADIAIKAEALSKRYRIGVQEQRPETFVARVVGSLSRPVTNLKRLVRLARFRDGEEDASDVVWALRDATFDVERGEVVGVIGRNGAGKSTLLKILARITAPTSGRATVHGSVQSLLEVGTGFHKELTGRENVYLNGAVLGMSRREIAQKFDEIVEFSGVEKFIDTPVKRYSSGMTVRLAFSVAAHLDPEILIVDEVLSVGDDEFQKKCVGKMGAIAAQGRTVLFVSHNLQAVTRLCSRVMLMEAGRKVLDTNPQDAVAAYLSTGVSGAAERVWPDPATAPGGDVVRLRAVRVVDENGASSDRMSTRTAFRIELEYDVVQPGYALRTNITAHHLTEGIVAFSLFDLDREWRGKRRPAGRYRTSVFVPGDLLAEGQFSITATVALKASGVVQFCEVGAVAFHIIDTLDGESARGDWGGSLGGALRPKLNWSTEFEPRDATRKIAAG